MLFVNHGQVYQIIKCRTTKGNALKKLKEMLPSIHTVIAR